MISSLNRTSSDLGPGRAPLLRSTVLALAGSTIILTVAGIVTVLWLWEVVRTQQHAVGQPLLDRADYVVGATIPVLAYVGMLLGIGLGLRLLADMMAERLGRLHGDAPEGSIGPDTP